MRERGPVLEDEATGQLIDRLSEIKRAANAAGYNTQAVEVQVALLMHDCALNVACIVSGSIDRLAEQIRRAKKSDGGYW